MGHQDSLLLKGLKVLESFSASHPTLRYAEIVNRTGLPGTTTFRILKALTENGYLNFDGTTKLYSPSLKLLTLGYTALSGVGLRRLAYPFMDTLSRKTKLNVNLGVLEGTASVYIESVRFERIVNAEIQVGWRLNAWQTSIGRAILAYLPLEKFDIFLREILPQASDDEQVGPDGQALRADMEEIRRKGYAFSDQVLIKGLRTLGAPIFDKNGTVCAAVSMLALNSFISKKKLINEYSPLIIQTAAEISRALGHVTAEIRRGG